MGLIGPTPRKCREQSSRNSRYQTPVIRALGGVYSECISPGDAATPDTGIAKIFMHGRSQAVRLPLAYRMPGDRVRVRRVANGVLLEPMVTDIDAWFAEIDRFAGVPFMEEGRRQPPMPGPEDLFE